MLKYGSWATSAGHADWYTIQTVSPEFGGDFSNLSCFLIFKVRFADCHLRTVILVIYNLFIFFNRLFLLYLCKKLYIIIKKINLFKSNKIIYFTILRLIKKNIMRKSFFYSIEVCSKLEFRNND